MKPLPGGARNAAARHSQVEIMEHVCRKEAAHEAQYDNHLLFVVLFVGLALLLYPSVSDFYNSFHQSRAVATYNTVVEQESKKDYEADWAAANAYNENSAHSPPLIA